MHTAWDHLTNSFYCYPYDNRIPYAIIPWERVAHSGTPTHYPSPTYLADKVDDINCDYFPAKGYVYGSVCARQKGIGQCSNEARPQCLRTYAAKFPPANKFLGYIHSV